MKKCILLFHAALLLLTAANLQAQINYQISGTVQLEFGDDSELGLDGSTAIFDAEFDTSDTWGPFVGFEGITPASATLTISGASVPQSNRVYTLSGQNGNQPTYFNFVGFGKPDLLNATFDGDILGLGKFGSFSSTAQVAGIKGVLEGDPILLEQFVPATDEIVLITVIASGLIDYSFVSGSVSITAEEKGVGMLGDMNCDQIVDLLDVSPFVLALTDPTGYEAAFPNCDISLGDTNGDDEITLLDVGPFVDILIGN